MKKYVAFLLIAALAAAFCGCVAEVPPALSVAPAESGERSVAVEGISSEEEKFEVSEPKEESSQEITEEIVPKDPLHLNNATMIARRGGVYVMEFRDENRDFSVRYYITTEDGLQEFHREGDYVDGYMDVYGYVTGSGDARRVILNNYTWEKPSDVYLYEASTGEKRQLDMSRLPRNELVTEMKWLDGRYFLFVSQFDHGTIAIGGDVWVYDTETDDYFRIIAREDGDMQISYIKVYDGMVLFTMYYYVDDAYDETETHYYALSAEEVYQLIETRSETIFCLGEWVH